VTNRAGRQFILWLCGEADDTPADLALVAHLEILIVLDNG